MMHRRRTNKRDIKAQFYAVRRFESKQVPLFPAALNPLCLSPQIPPACQKAPRCTTAARRRDASFCLAAARRTRRRRRRTETSRAASPVCSARNHSARKRDGRTQKQSGDARKHDKKKYIKVADGGWGGGGSGRVCHCLARL